MSKKKPLSRPSPAAEHSNPSEAPFLPITLDRPRRLLFDFNALIHLGETLGQNMLEPAAWDRIMGITRGDEGKMVSMQPEPRCLRALLWAGLLADDTTVDGEPWKKPPELTLERTGHLLQLGNAGQVMASLLRAQNLQADVPDQKESGSRRPPLAAVGAAQESNG